MKEGNIKIETYKKVDLFYNKENGRILFGFEGSEREVKYVFEARQIIDEPIWEEGDFKGFIIDGTFSDHIGLAKATRKNIKNGKPDWKFKNKYDLDYTGSRYSDDRKVYLLTKENLAVYKEFETQRDILLKEERKLKQIISKLS